MGISEVIRNWLFGPIIEKLNHIDQEVTQMAVNQADFDIDLAQLGTDVALLVNAVQKLIAKLSEPPVVDLTNEDTGVKSMDDSVKIMTAAANSVLGL